MRNQLQTTEDEQIILMHASIFLIAFTKDFHPPQTYDTSLSMRAKSIVHKSFRQ